MSNLSWVPRINVTKTVVVVPTIASATFSAGQQLGGIMTLTDVVRYESNLGAGSSLLASINIIDSSKQAQPIDLLIFNQSPTLVSSSGSAFSQTYANAKLQLIGVVNCGTAYSTTASYSISSTANLNLSCQSVVGTPSSNLYAVAVAQGTIVTGATNVFQFGFSFYVD